MQTLKAVIPVSKSVAGYQVSPAVNNSYLLVNDLLAAGTEVFRITAGKDQGEFFIPFSSKVKNVLEKTAAENGMTIRAVKKRPASNLRKITPRKIALWDNYGGSLSSGWVRWLMEQYHFPIQLVYAKDIDAGELHNKFDIILFVTRAIPAVKQPGEGNDVWREPKEEEIPAEFHNQLGSITAEKSIPQLKKFMEEGGSVFTIGSSTSLAYHIGLPVRNALTEMTADGVEKALPGEKYYIPGSILQVSVDSSRQAAWGMGSKADVYFDSSPVFKISPDAVSRGTVKPLMWFDNNKPLRSGWAWGQAYLQGGVTAFEANVGKGKLFAFGPEITFRSQSYGTFKLLFNQLYSVDEEANKALIVRQ